MKYNNEMNNEGWTTQDYRDSVSAKDTNDMFTLAYQWQDKPHRHVWDLCSWIDNLQRENKRLKLDVKDNIQYREEAVENLDRYEKAEAENMLLRKKVKRLQSPDMRIILGFDSGEKSAAIRCAEIASEYNSVEGIAEKITKTIEEEFNL
ncbi:MAG: hypothetical protein U9N86_17435 [Bacteroidota bacterium]|nr:hypothetical protein [Bacteroidota bacterium]